MVLPSGTVTLLFTDIEGSTRLLHELGERYVQVLADHRRALRRAVAACDGVEVDTQGDAFFIALANARDAVAAAHAAQVALAKSPVRVRMGIHTGTPTVTAEGYVGIDVHRGARICAAGHGGQILVSNSTRAELGQDDALKDLGEHRLKDLQTPEWLFQLIAPDLEPRFPPLRSLSNTNLPADASKFIGRQRELDELGALLDREDVRLLTLTGAGGSGKTRLAIRLATESVERFKNGVFFVSLAPLSDAALVVGNIAQTIGAKESGTEGSAVALRKHLEGKQVLLVLDNFEHLLAAAPEVSALLASAAQLKVIVTSRQRLRLAGEHEYAVPPLPEDDAVALFDVRARAARPSFRIDLERAPVLAICRRLDGLPLAVELAAARVKVLKPEALFARLELRLPVLTDGPRDMPDRQRTLRATIEWSYLLLDEHEQEVLAQLSVFVGGWDASAAEQVCGATLDDLASLLDKSLLVSEDAGTEPRFSMLATIREYARERLEHRGLLDELLGRNARYFAALAENRSEGRGHGTATAPAGPNESWWLDWLESERPNLISALSWLVDRGEAELAMLLAFSLWRLWLMRRPLAEGRQWTERVLGIPGVSDLSEYSWLLAIAAEFPRFQGDHPRARALNEEAIALFRARGEKIRLAVAIEALASIMATQGEHREARALHEESLALGRELESPYRIAYALNGLTVLAFLERDFLRMRDLANEQLVISRAKNDDMYIAAALHNLAEAQRHLGDLDPAALNYDEALTLSVRIGDRSTIAECLDGLADVASAMHEPRRASSLWAYSERVFSEGGELPWDADGAQLGIAEARAGLGSAAFEEAWAQGAAMSQDEAVAAARPIIERAQGTSAARSP